MVNNAVTATRVWITYGLVLAEVYSFRILSLEVGQLVSQLTGGVP